LKETREVAVVTLVGRLFHARAAVTWKDRSPMLRPQCSYKYQLQLKSVTSPTSTARIKTAKCLKCPCRLAGLECIHACSCSDCKNQGNSEQEGSADIQLLGLLIMKTYSIWVV